MIETHTDRPGRGIEGGVSGGGVTGSSSALTALSDGVSCSSATAEGERRERRQWEEMGGEERDLLTFWVNCSRLGIRLLLLLHQWLGSVGVVHLPRRAGDKGQLATYLSHTVYHLVGCGDRGRSSCCYQPSVGTSSSSSRRLGEPPPC